MGFHLWRRRRCIVKNGRNRVSAKKLVILTSLQGKILTAAASGMRHSADSVQHDAVIVSELIERAPLWMLSEETRFLIPVLRQ